MKKLLPLLLFPLFIVSCHAIQDLANNIKKPSLSVDDVHITGFNFREMQLTYDIKVDNPNPVALNMLGYDYNLKVNDHSFLKGDQTKKVNIESSGQSIVQVPLTINFKELYNTVEGVANKDQSSYNFLSHLAFDLPVLGKTKIPVHKKGNIPIVKLPKVNVQNISVDNLSLNGADMNLHLQFDNPNGFGLNINQLKYNLMVNGNKWAVGKALKGVDIKKDGVTNLDIPISLDIGQIGMSAYKLLTDQQSLDYKLKGNFKFNVLHELLGAANYNFDRSGAIPINR